MPVEISARSPALARDADRQLASFVDPLGTMSYRYAEFSSEGGDSEYQSASLKVHEADSESAQVGDERAVRA
jgi:hypothetical protein